MSAEAVSWLRYASENLRASRLCLKDSLHNPALQNAQQAVEKSLKALCDFYGIPFAKTHSIGSLCHELERGNFESGLTEEECDLLDSIYLPSKYPLGSVLPEYHPDEELASHCIAIAERVYTLASKSIEKD